MFLELFKPRQKILKKHSEKFWKEHLDENVRKFSK